MPISSFFYPRISYGSGPVVIDFGDPVNEIFLRIAPIAGANVAEDGTREQLTQRIEYTVMLRFHLLKKTDLDPLWTWWSTHAYLGKQSALTLDRFATTGAQFEGTQFNSFFSKAELVNAPFGPDRSILQGARHRLELTFRQGT
jgi:hypothetical protein